MPADREDLARRLAAASDADTTRGLNFNALFALVRDELGEGACREIDPARKGSRVDLFSYSMRDYLRAAWDAADRLEPRLGSIEAVWHELGTRTVRGFLSSVLGRAIFAIAGRDPRRLISAGPAGYRAGASYGERKVEWLGERHARLVFKRDFMPSAFNRAVVLTAVQSTNARNPRVDAKDTGFLESVYEISWDG
jgi:uncharacterized protein (TIGR02265 family)